MTKDTFGCLPQCPCTTIRQMIPNFGLVTRTRIDCNTSLAFQLVITIESPRAPYNASLYPGNFPCQMGLSSPATQQSSHLHFAGAPT